MLRVSALAALMLAAASVAACGGGDRTVGAEPAASDPRMAAAFTEIMRGSINGAERAKEWYVEAEQRRDDDVAAAGRFGPPGPRIMFRPSIPGGDLLDVMVRLPGVALRFRRGMDSYPDALLDPQAEAFLTAVRECSETDEMIDLVRSTGSVTVTVRIDANVTPPRADVIGGHGLDACVARELRILPADGVFVAVARIVPP